MSWYFLLSFNLVDCVVTHYSGADLLEAERQQQTLREAGIITHIATDKNVALLCWMDGYKEGQKDIVGRGWVA